MSTDRQRLKSAIQRIAEQSPAISEAIGTAKNKGGQASSSGTGISDAERDNLCCDGSEGSGANAGSDTRDPDEGGSDALDPNDPANLDGIGPGSLTGVTDCATGQPICFDGNDWLPPDGWNDPQSPPLDPTFEEGTYWVSNVNGVVIEHQTCGPAMSRVNLWLTGCEEDPRSCPDNFGVSLSGIHPVCPNESGGVSPVECDASPDPICDEDAPRLTAWPEDSCTNLAIKGGRLVGSKFDPENDGSYSAPRDELEVCDDFGNSFLLRGSPAGGWKSIKSLEGDIDPDTGNGYLYRPNGQRIRQISPSEFRDDTV